MSSPGFNAPLALDLRPSRYLVGALVTLTLLAACGSAMLAFPWSVAGPVAAASGGAWELRRLRRRTRLHWHADGTWSHGAATDETLRLDGATCANGWFVLLVLRGHTGIRRFLLTRDTVAPVRWRRLQARLRVEGLAQGSGG